jgi:hypothetical protein
MGCPKGCDALASSSRSNVLAIPVAVGALTILRRRLNGPLQLRESKKEARGYRPLTPSSPAGKATTRKQRPGSAHAYRR